MKTLTFDWNCVIAAELGDESEPFVDKLVALHRQRVIDVGITTISASESLKGSQEFPASAKQFRQRLARLGWNDLTLIMGPAVIGLTYIGLTKLLNDGERFNRERDAIWKVVGGSTQRQLPTPLSDESFWSAKFKKWRNVWCDVHTLWTHIDSGRDVFITTNSKDFQIKAPQLTKLGLREVKSPKDMVRELA